jgi:chorismate dehydratase
MRGRRKVLVGAVSYLNTKPLVHELADRCPWVELVFDLPSRLADRLACGGLDVALIPSIELLREPGYSIVSDACIGCCGAVLSVKLFSRVPVERLQTLALDEGSRTSVALVRILLKRRFAVEPRITGLPIGMEPAACDADAMLVIGDRAIHGPPGEYAVVWDLGAEWLRWTGLPFVFAMWVARPGVPHTALAEALGAARDRGLAALPQIAAAAAAPLGLESDECLIYLRDRLHFQLGPDEVRGLELFYRFAADVGMAPEDRAAAAFAASAALNDSFAAAYAAGMTQAD